MSDQPSPEHIEFIKQLNAAMKEVTKGQAVGGTYGSATYGIYCVVLSVVPDHTSLFILSQCINMLSDKLTASIYEAQEFQKMEMIKPASDKVN